MVSNAVRPGGRLCPKVMVPRIAIGNTAAREPWVDKTGTDASARAQIKSPLSMLLPMTVPLFFARPALDPIDSLG